MKPLLHFPRLSRLSLALFLTVGIILVSDTGCKPKPACGSRRDHIKRKKKVHKIAPSMGANNKHGLKSNEIAFS